MKQQKLLKYADMSNFFLVVEKKNISSQKKKTLIKEFIRIVEQEEKAVESDIGILDGENLDSALDSVASAGKEGFGDYAVLAFVQFLMQSMGIASDSFLGIWFANRVKNFAKRGFNFSELYDMYEKGECEKIADILLIDFEDAVVQKIIQSMLGGQASGVSGVLPGTVQEMIKNAIRDSGFAVKVRDLIADKICEFELKDIPSTLKAVAGGALGSIVDLFS